MLVTISGFRQCKTIGMVQRGSGDDDVGAMLTFAVLFLP